MSSSDEAAVRLSIAAMTRQVGARYNGYVRVVRVRTSLCMFKHVKAS